MELHTGNDEKREGAEGAAAGEERLGEMLGASESGPAGRQIENRPGRALGEILSRLGLTP